MHAKHRSDFDLCLQADSRVTGRLIGVGCEGGPRLLIGH